MFVFGGSAAVKTAGIGRTDVPKVTYIEHTGSEHVVDIAVGDNVMRGAVDNNVPGIDGDCGGVRACATCHVHVDETWIDRVGVRSDPIEEDMLSFSPELLPTSRLGCQIEITPDLDGLVVRLPSSQT